MALGAYQYNPDDEFELEPITVQPGMTLSPINPIIPETGQISSGRGGTYNWDDLLDQVNPLETQRGTTTSTSPITYSDYYARPSGSITTTRAIKPSGALPSLTMPELALPDYNEADITSKTQKIASPIIRSQRQMAERALMRHYDNPNVAKLVSGEILRQFGTNLAQSLSGARQTAANEYMRQLQLERQKVQTEYAVKQQQALVNYEAALQDYMNQYGQQTYMKYTYGDEEETKKNTGYGSIVM